MTREKCQTPPLDYALSAGRVRGVALITALLVAAMVAALAMTLTSRSTLWINQVQNRQDFDQAKLIALSAIDVARLTLRDDARNNNVDHLQEAWAIPIPPVSAESGKVGGRIVEMQGFFNLANLVRDGKVNASAVQGLQRLLSLQGLDPALASKLETALERKLEARKKAGIATGFPIADLSELEDIPGFDAPTLSKLREDVVVLPEPTRINVNFARPEVMAATVPALNAGEAASVISARSGSYFRTTQAFVDALPEGLRGKIDSDLCTVQSRYFLAEIDASFGRVKLRYEALLLRAGSGVPDVVWVRRAYL